MSYRQSEDDLLDQWLDELDEDAVQGTMGNVEDELELVKRALDSAELGYAIEARSNDGENDAMMNHLRSIRGNLVAYLQSQED